MRPPESLCSDWWKWIARGVGSTTRVVRPIRSRKEIHSGLFRIHLPFHRPFQPGLSIRKRNAAVLAHPRRGYSTIPLDLDGKRSKSTRVSTSWHGCLSPASKRTGTDVSTRTNRPPLLPRHSVASLRSNRLRKAPCRLLAFPSPLVPRSPCVAPLQVRDRR